MRIPELTAVAAALPPRHPKIETNPDSETLWYIWRAAYGLDPQTQ